MKKYLFFILTLVSLDTYAQTEGKDFKAIDEYIKGLGAMEGMSTATINNVVINHFDDKVDKLRAIYTWIALNITYDAKAARTNNTQKNKPADVLATRKAVGLGFASLFQDMCSSANIRWLARVFGCDDPVATGEWQVELSAAQSRLTAKRRERKKAGSDVALGLPDIAQPVAITGGPEFQADLMPDIGATESRRRFSLARRSEALFCQGSPLNLPASVFAGISALGFLSFILGIHNVKYARPDGIIKQVGFLWAANWIFVFMVFLPLFLAFVAELVISWEDPYEGRSL